MAKHHRHSRGQIHAHTAHPAHHSHHPHPTHHAHPVHHRPAGAQHHSTMGPAAREQSAKREARRAAMIRAAATAAPVAAAATLATRRPTGDGLTESTGAPEPAEYSPQDDEAVAPEDAEASVLKQLEDPGEEPDIPYGTEAGYAEDEKNTIGADLTREQLKEAFEKAAAGASATIAKHRKEAIARRKGMHVNGGWYRKPLWADDLFRKEQGHEPSDGDLFQLRKLVAYANGGIAAGNEATFELGHEMIWFYVKTGHFPGKKARDKLAEKAKYTVWQHVQHYRATHHSFFGDLGHAITGAARWAGGAVGTITHAAAVAVDAAGNAIAKVPIIGTPLHAALNLMPFHLIDDLSHGVRIDHAFLNHFKQELAGARELAPYAATVVSMVPGVGSGVAAAIATASALAQGRPITEALKDAVRSAIPGGPLAQQGFDMATKVASGENIGKAALEAARSQLPAEAQKAFDVGLALAHGEKLQNALVGAAKNLAPEGLKPFAEVGRGVVNADHILSAVKANLPDVSHQGFNLGAGLLAHSGVPEGAIVAFRNKLGPAARRGFDAALSAHTRRFPVELHWPISAKEADALHSALTSGDPKKKEFALKFIRNAHNAKRDAGARKSLVLLHQAAKVARHRNKDGSFPGVMVVFDAHDKSKHGRQVLSKSWKRARPSDPGVIEGTLIVGRGKAKHRLTGYWHAV